MNGELTRSFFRAVTNERVSGQAKQHAQEEIGRIESEGESGGEQEQVEQQPNPANMKRGLKAYVATTPIPQELVQDLV